MSPGTGPAPAGSPPIRRCVSCRRRAAKTALVRLGVTGGRLAVDAEARLPGRGVYVCDRRTCLEQALAGGGRQALRALRADARTAVEASDVAEGWQAAVGRMKGQHHAWQVTT